MHDLKFLLLNSILRFSVDKLNITNRLCIFERDNILVYYINTELYEFKQVIQHNESVLTRKIE
jgi:hypothetical protein